MPPDQVAGKSHDALSSATPTAPLEDEVIGEEMIQLRKLETPLPGFEGRNGAVRRSRATQVTILTTAQHLGSILKTARKKMRADKGLSSDLDRLPTLAWIMFLKLLDDSERLRGDEAIMREKTFRPSIEPPYRWRDWAAKADGITGPELLAFINNDEAVRPDGTRGPGLFAYLRDLHGGATGDRREVIARAFQGADNRMKSGYLLREVINKVNDIHFTDSGEVQILSTFYESMLREMRDAAGDSGEFYTPRPLVQFIVEAVNPQLGETVLDPACGTGGFLVAAYQHLEKQSTSVEDHRLVQEKSIFGGEPKPLPYLLAQMNLLLHGVEYPRIDPENSLRFQLTQLGDKDRVDVVLTNPPFGGEEEPGIQNNFPADKRTSETALLFLQLIMRRLRRQPAPGRAGVVVPDGTLFGDGVAARIKEELLTQFNLHTVIRLPEGVFSPYTDIATNILFFDRTGPTSSIWYFQLPRPDGRRKYTKTLPLRFDEFAPVLEWWNHRVGSEHAWQVPASQVLSNGCNLDIKNPHAAETVEHLPPAAIVDQIRQQVGRLDELVAEIQGLLAQAE